MKFESDTIKSDTGDDNLRITLRVDIDDFGNYYEVIVNKDEVPIQKYMSRSEDDANVMYDKWHKEF